MKKRLLNCKTCEREISSKAKVCPGCGAKNKKTFYKRPWFLMVAFLIILIGIGNINDNSDNIQLISEFKQETTQDDSTVSIKNKESKKEEDIPKEYKSALKKAQMYVDAMPLSKSKLFNQLTLKYGEKFSTQATQYAVDNVDVNWNENALEIAKVYKESMSMPPSEIYKKLTSEDGEAFSKEEAQYAIDNLNL